MLPNDSCPKTILPYITKKRLIDIFPNVYVALRILLTLPVSVASGERSFSKLKIIKNYLRSTLSQDHLSGMATLAIEHQVLSTIETDSFLKDFAKVKARKVCFQKFLKALCLLKALQLFKIIIIQYNVIFAIYIAYKSYFTMFIILCHFVLLIYLKNILLGLFICS